MRVSLPSLSLRFVAAMAAALVITTSTSGCALAPRIELVSQDGHPPVAREPFDWPRPIRVGVLPDSTRYEPLHDRVVRTLADGIDRVVRDHRPSAASERVDYVLAVDIDVDGDGRVSNFLAVFPGFLVFAPSWYQLRWDYQVETTVRILRGHDHVVVRELNLRDRFVCRYSPVGMAVGAYIGWGAILFPPLVISPLVTGIVAASDDWDPRRFARLLAQDSEAGHVYAGRIAHAVREAIDADLRYE
jgi:hypothetical protein